MICGITVLRRALDERVKCLREREWRGPRINWKERRLCDEPVSG
jgi:hypothetical protein